MDRKLKPWREVAIPHEDVLRGTFQHAEFAADLTRVHAGTATPEYQDPSLFFQRTFITEGMRLLLDSVLKRLSGRGGDPVIQLQTAFGGGKTHTMLAVYHLAGGAAPASRLQGIEPLLTAAGLSDIPQARLVVLDGNHQAPNIPQQRGSVQVRTLWGELAWQLGDEAGYERVRQADESGTSPGKEVLVRLLSAYAPCVVLVDELAAYLRQFEEGKSLSGGTFDSNLSFVQALTEALKAVPNAVLLASLPESEREAGSRRGQEALKVLEHCFGRVQALWKPVATEEAFEIVRRRLFRPLSDTAAMRDVCRAFADLYLEWPDDLPRETQETRYFDRLVQAYPIHPEFFDRLYEDWSTLETFQRTRGVLKLMARIIHRLWKDGNNELLLMPGSLPLYEGDTRNDLLNYLPAGWDPVVERDIDGERAETAALENQDPRFGAAHACRRVARAIFLGSTPGTKGQVARGLEVTRLVLGTLQPGQQPGLYRDALGRLQDRLHHLNAANDRYWFDTRPNLRREMEERKRRFHDREDVHPLLHARVQKHVTSDFFGAVHVFTPSKDIPDDAVLRLVVLPPGSAYASNVPDTPAVQAGGAILVQRGEQVRSRQNRLVFLAPDLGTVGRLQDQARTVLAWESIGVDADKEKILLDKPQVRQVAKALQDAEDVLRRMVSETWRWVLAPMQEARPGGTPSKVQWEAWTLNAAAPDLGRDIARVLKDNEAVIDAWSPIHLARHLERWFWKPDTPAVGALEVWKKTCQYLFLPRLRDEEVYRKTLDAGVGSRDFFAVALGRKEDRYVGFRYGQTGPLVLDESLLLLSPEEARREESRRAEEERKRAEADAPPVGGSDAPASGTETPGGGSLARDERVPYKAPPPRLFYGSTEVNAYQAQAKFSDVVTEVVRLFTDRPGVKVEIQVEIRAVSPQGFDDNLQRAVRDNCRHLGFKNAEFEAGD